MKRFILSHLFLFLLFGLNISAQDNPVADEAAVVQSGNVRFTILTPRLIRIQYSKPPTEISTSPLFEDRATFAVVNRRLPVPEFTKEERDGYLYITTSALNLKYRIGAAIRPAQHTDAALSITFNLNGRTVLWYPGKDDAFNLKGTMRTLDGDIGDSHRPNFENGLLSRDGWAIVDESPSAKRGDDSRTFAFGEAVDGIPWVEQPVDPNAIDMYFFGYGHDYKDALADYVKIAGRQPMPPRYMFGYWYSKYQRYTADDFRNLVTDINANDIPLDVMIFDMDWHKDGWTGWSWNKNLIPDGKGLITWMHDHDLKVALNLHPADGVNNYEDNFQRIRRDMGMEASATNVPWQISNPTFYRTFFKNIIRLRESEGVDFWWIDWQQDLIDKYVDGLGETFWINHVFYNDMRLNRPDRRPVIFHRWGGMGSHRYPIGFSGDTFHTFGTLAFEPYFTATASNVCFGYWGHDLGGHLQPAEQPVDPELYLRWLQYGVFSPILRTHGASQATAERRIWKFDNFPLMLDAVNLRYTLAPYIYTAAREAYDTGVSICRPLYYEYPEDNRSYEIQNQYFFGNDILVAPVVTPTEADGKATRKIWLPEGQWFDVCRNQLVSGDVQLTDRFSTSEIPYYYRAGAIVPCYPKLYNLKSEPDMLMLRVIPGADGEGKVYEDDGDSEGYKDGLFATTTIAQQRTSQRVVLTISPRVGRYPDIADERAWQLEFLGEEAEPEAVLVNGEAFNDWTYDAAAKTVTVALPKTSCDAQTVVELRRVATSIEQPAVFDAPDALYTLHDAGGRLLLASASYQQLQATLASLPAGTYVCTAVSGQQKSTRKIVK